MSINKELINKKIETVTTISLQIKIEKQLKNDASNTLEDLGLSLNDAVKLFLKQVVNTGTIPFTIKPSKQLVIESNDDYPLSESEKNELLKIFKEYKSGKRKSIKFENNEEAINYLDQL
jgi:addiction module RelB/DinJ family antitoxin